MRPEALKGIIAYPVTPFLANASGIDEQAFRAVIDALLRTGPSGVAVLGSAGESAYLRDVEWRRAVEIVAVMMDVRDR